LIFSVGFCIVGGQSGLNALAAASYPSNIRATGIGASVGVGRLFSICGPLLAGEALRAGLSAHAIFICSALPAFACATILMALKATRISQDSREVTMVEVWHD
jgi:AAHS family 4-hydroxybenzoate transporter-like MFS transporter